MADQKPTVPFDPTTAKESDFPPPPPGPPPTQQQTAIPATEQVEQAEQAHPNPLSANPLGATPAIANDEETRQQQELLEHWQREHQRKLAGLPPSEEHQPRPPQPPRPSQDTTPSQPPAAIPAYNPADPQFASQGPTHFPSEYQNTTAAAPSASVPAGTAPPVAASGHEVSPHTSPVEGEEEHKTSKWSSRFANLGLKAAAPINQLAHKLGSQSFLPETLPKECDKAAGIIQSFCKSGVTADPDANSKLPASLDPSSAKESSSATIDPTKEKPRERVIVTIPPKVIARAVGLAIFTTLRAGFNVTGATGSGILIARLPDGSWGPPSGIQVHSVGGGFSIGVDIYDCVCVINSKEALKAFSDTRVSLGSDLAVTAGPYGAGGAVDVGRAMESGRDARKASTGGSTSPLPQDLPPPTAATEQSQGLKPEEKKTHRRSLSASGFKPVFSYVKSRGFYAGINVDGTVVVERKEANAAFYGSHVSVDQIVSGQVPAGNGPNMWPAGAQSLLQTLRNVDKGALQAAASPTTQPAAESIPVPAYGTAAAPPPQGNAPVASGGAGPAPPVHGEEQLPGYDERLSKPAAGDFKYA